MADPINRYSGHPKRLYGLDDPMEQTLMGISHSTCTHSSKEGKVEQDGSPTQC